MVANLLGVLASTRFHLIVAAAAMYVLQGGDILTAMEAIFGITAGVGTLDKFGKSLGGTK